MKEDADNVFAGKDYIEQLKLIVKTLGTPPDDDMLFSHRAVQAMVLFKWETFAYPRFRSLFALFIFPFNDIESSSKARMQMLRYAQKRSIVELPVAQYPPVLVRA